jgi:hypothetical protein
MNRTLLKLINNKIEATFYSAWLYTVYDNGWEIMKLFLILIICCVFNIILWGRLSLKFSVSLLPATDVN